ncbi:hypothetical protein AUJ84_03980 [Candidatus Pacearchaeota archaeon CG1_02_32_132]|nr:MAG: hypothetical protein AUJ84_03980 [Candidatus Pacearchaeota archaeon CG1_02_32_132]
MFIDVHCHLDLVEKETDIEKVVKECKKNKINFVSDGTNVESNRKMLEYAKKYNVSVCLGIYPEHVMEMNDKELKDEFDFILKNNGKISGIGEVGMDFVKGKEAKQEKYFREFIKLAKKIDKPITVHSRKAEKECIEILEDLKVKKVIMHYFSGNMNLVKRIIDNGWFLSIPTCVKYSEHFQKVIEIVPVELLLCETDSPYSHPDRKFPNNPNNVIESYKMVAEIKKMKLKDVEKQLEKNFKRLFGR